MCRSRDGMQISFCQVTVQTARWYSRISSWSLFDLLNYEGFSLSVTASARGTTDALHPLMLHSNSCTRIIVVGPFIWRGERFGFEPSPARQEAEMESLRLFTSDPAFTVKQTNKQKTYNIRQLWSLGSSICK